MKMDRKNKNTFLRMGKLFLVKGGMKMVQLGDNDDKIY